MARVLKLLVALLALPGCASELVLDHDGALAVVPRQFGDTGHIVVDVMMNGSGPFKFALDTGASISVVFDKARQDAAIAPVTGTQVHVYGMTGTGLFQIATVDRIDIGKEHWLNARVALMPDDTPIATSIDGILGMDFLSRYAVHYSQQDHTVRLYARELVAERAYLDWSSIPLFDLRVRGTDVSTPAFDMHIDGERIPSVFDLGATVNLMNRRAARVLGVPVRRQGERPEVLGVTGKTVGLTELIVWRLQIMDMYWRKRSFLIGDFPIFEALGLGGKPAAVAGTSLFGTRDFIIDFERMRLLVRSRE